MHTRQCSWRSAQVSAQVSPHYLHDVAQASMRSASAGASTGVGLGFVSIIRWALVKPGLLSIILAYVFRYRGCYLALRVPLFAPGGHLLDLCLLGFHNATGELPYLGVVGTLLGQTGHLYG